MDHDSINVNEKSAWVPQETRRRRPWVKKAVIGGIVAAVFLGFGILAGFYIGKAATPSSSSSAPPAASLQAVQLPPPGSAAAEALMADPSTPRHVRDIYEAASDAATITPKDTAAFLKRLERKLGTMGYEVDLSIFVDLANSVVDLLRVARADALLTLLRQYATSGTLALEAVDQDQLQTEVNSVLQPPVWDNFFRYTSVRDFMNNTISSRSWGTAFPVTGAPPGEPAAAGGRHRLLQQAGEHPSGRRSMSRWQRRLAAAASIPVIREAPDIGPSIGGVLPTDLPPQTLQDMLCGIAPYAANTTDTSNCPAPRTARFSHGGVTFKPVNVPVVFHCMRFLDGNGTLQPPYWNPMGDATHLIEATNKLYRGTGFTFSLKEVRADPVQYPYLLMNGTMEDWQGCGSSPATFQNRFSCLRNIAKENGDRTLAINVIIVGAVYAPAFCDFNDAKAACNQLFLGYSNTNGPWMASPSATWTEDNREENWIHITWDYISPEYKNNLAKWDGGAATLGHEIGHYLGLRHTHEGSCSGDGTTVADAVPDTPMNKDVQSYAGDMGLTRELARFCSNWRNGQPADTAVLRKFNSCDRTNMTQVDNVFNILSYVPDQCVMIFTENQVARLQWAMVTFRPQLMARYAA